MRRLGLMVTLSIVGALALGVTAIGGTAYSSFKATTANPKSSWKSSALYDCGKSAQWTGAFLHYGYNEASGTVATDEGGSARNGTLDAGVNRTGGNCAASPYISLNGSTQVTTPQAVGPAPQVFTVETWFRTTTAGGKLIGYGLAQSGQTDNGFDRHIYMTDDGYLVYGIFPGPRGEDNAQYIYSDAALNDGQWHMATATTSSAGSSFYVDGVLQGSDPAMTAAETESDGYWRIGYDNIYGWWDAPTNPHYVGDLDNSSVWYTALSASTIRAHYTAGR